MVLALAFSARADEALGLQRVGIPAAKHLRMTDANGNVIGGSPDGCPRIAFCGCAVALKVFGHPERNLWQARAWFRFPRTYAHAGAVAVTSRHVFLLLSHIEGTRWLAYDPNSGGHKTRIHERDIRGTTLVDPMASRVAEARP
jgi:hypothetical protein